MQGAQNMTITRKNFDILKKAALSAANSLEVLQAIEETENASKAANKKMTQYITERRKLDKNYCR